MSGAIPLLPLYALVTWAVTTLPLRISLHSNSFQLNTVNTFPAQCNSSRVLLRNFSYSPASLSPSCVRILPLAVCFKA